MNRCKLLAFVALMFFSKTLSAQFNGLYYAYTDKSISKKEIKKNVKEIFVSLDSIKTANQMNLDVKFHICLYFTDLSDSSKAWSNFQNDFYKEITKVARKEKVFLHPSSTINGNVTTKVNHLSIGPMFYSSYSE